VKIELQQITRMVRRLPCTAARSGMTEAKLPKIKRCNKSFDHSNRIVASHIIFHTRRQQARLMPADAGLERTIRHAESYRPSPNLIRFLPSLYAPSALRTQDDGLRSVLSVSISAPSVSSAAISSSVNPASRN